MAEEAVVDIETEDLIVDSLEVDMEAEVASKDRRFLSLRKVLKTTSFLIILGFRQRTLRIKFTSTQLTSAPSIILTKDVKLSKTSLQI